MLPRLLWVQKELTLKELHMQIFKHVRHIFSEWADLTDPNTKRNIKANLRNLIAFPHKKPGTEEAMTKEDFDKLSDEEAFNLLFSGVIDGECDGDIQSSANFDIEKMPY